MKKSILFHAQSGIAVGVIDKPEHEILESDFDALTTEPDMMVVVEWDTDTDKVSFCPPIGPNPCWTGHVRSEFADNAALWKSLDEWAKETF